MSKRFHLSKSKILYRLRTTLLFALPAEAMYVGFLYYSRDSAEFGNAWQLALLACLLLNVVTVGFYLFKISRRENEYVEFSADSITIKRGKKVKVIDGKGISNARIITGWRPNENNGAIIIDHMMNEAPNKSVIGNQYEATLSELHKQIGKLQKSKRRSGKKKKR